MKSFLLILLLLTLGSCEEEFKEERRPMVIQVTVTRRVYYVAGPRGQGEPEGKEEPGGKGESETTSFPNSSIPLEDATKAPSQLQQFMEIIDSLFSPTSPLDFSFVPHVKIKKTKYSTFDNPKNKKKM